MAQFSATKGPSARRDLAWIMPRHDFLAGAGRAGDEHARAGGGDALDRVAQAGDAVAVAGQAGVAAHAQAQLGILALQLRGFQGALDDQQQAVGIEGLFDEVIGAALDGGDGGLDGAVAGDHHHRHARHLLVQHVENADAVELGALQPDIEDDERSGGGRGRRRSPRRSCRRCAPHSLRPENRLDQQADIRLVIDDQDLGHRAGNSFISSTMPHSSGQRWQNQGHLRADSARRRFQLQPSSMVLHDLGDNGKAKAGAFRLMGHIRFGQAVAVRSRAGRCRRPSRSAPPCRRLAAAAA